MAMAELAGKYGLVEVAARLGFDHAPPQHYNWSVDPSRGWGAIPHWNNADRDKDYTCPSSVATQIVRQVVNLGVPIYALK
jgi:hypothetical protein